MEGSAMPTTVASRKAMPEPSTVAASTQRPRAVRSARGSERPRSAGRRHCGQVCMVRVTVVEAFTVAPAVGDWVRMTFGGWSSWWSWGDGWSGWSMGGGWSG